MPIVWVKRVYIKIPRIKERIYRTVLGSVKEGFAVVTNIQQPECGHAIHQTHPIGCL
jgi:hypothetical protein